MIFVFTLMLIWLGAWFFPWWWVPLAAALVAFWRLRSVWRLLPQAFFAGALAWFLPSLWKDFLNDSILSEKIAMLFYLHGHWSILGVTSVLAGMLALLGALSGQRLRRLLQALVEKF